MGRMVSSSEELAIHLRRLLYDRELAAQLGAQGESDNDSRYHLDQMVARYLEVYAAVVSNKGRPTSRI